MLPWLFSVRVGGQISERNFETMEMFEITGRDMRIELATSDVTGLPHLPYPKEFQPLTPARESSRYILGIPFGVRFGVRFTSRASFWSGLAQLAKPHESLPGSTWLPGAWNQMDFPCTHEWESLSDFWIFPQDEGSVRRSAILPHISYQNWSPEMRKRP